MSHLTPDFHHDDWQQVQQETSFDGFFKVSTLTLKHKLFRGGWSQEVQRERFDRGPAVGVLMHDPIRDEIVLTQQFRVGAIDEASPWIFEVVAGMIEKGESPESVAIREAREESGAVIQTLTPICQYLVSPGGTDEKMHMFYTQVDAGVIEGIHGLDSEAEDIKIHKIPTQEAFACVRDGRINNAATVIALQWLEIQMLKGTL